MSSPLPFARSGETGLAVQRVGPLYTANGVSPQSVNLTLPGYGVWNGVIKAAFGNANNVALVEATITWFKFDAAGASANSALKTSLIGAPAFSVGPGNPTINALTVSDPTATGVVTVGIGWSDSATVRTAWVGMVLRQMITPADIVSFP